ncbi:MAG: hypothetical protein IPO06_06745 [Leptospiraceae bacterium]|nr:hypothetical protein [Leptospiraceae bacterium]
MFLYWMQAYQRFESNNPLELYAIFLGKVKPKELVVYEGLRLITKWKFRDFISHIRRNITITTPEPQKSLA